MRRVLPALLLAGLMAGWLAPTSGCAGSRPSLETTAARLAEAPTPEARAAVAAERLADGGATPLAGGASPVAASVWTWGAPPVVAAWVPGLDPLGRGRLVTVAAALDGPAAAETLEAVRRLVGLRTESRPGRSVLVGLWPAGLTPAEGLAHVRRLPLWPDSLRDGVLVVGTETVPGTETLHATGPTGDALVARIVETVLALADAPLPVPDPVADSLTADARAVR